MTPVTLLLDADIIAYTYAFTGEKKFRWDVDDVSIAYTDFAEVERRVEAHIEDLVTRLGADDIIVCQSCPTVEGFRIKLWPEYKAGRPEKPLYVEPIKAHLAKNYRTYAKPQLEADDIQGILSTHPTLIPGKKIIVSIDKDMKTIPGWLFNPMKDKYEHMVSEEEADQWFYFQTLTGDSTDHYPGLRGCGEKGAANILDHCLFMKTTFWEGIVAAYEGRGYTADDALIQARLARILRHTDYDFTKQEPILWEPPSMTPPPTSGMLQHSQ